MTPPSAETARFRLEYLATGVLTLRWARSIEVTAGDIEALGVRVQALAPGCLPPILADLNGMVTLSREAFTALSSARNLPAVAVVGASPVERVLVAHFQAVHRPSYPIEYFERRDEALTWLLRRSPRTAVGPIPAAPAIVGS